LSGDQHVDPHPDGRTSVDTPTASVFNFAALLAFTILAVAAIAYRRRPDVHKRLMLFANISLMIAPIAHLVGHTPSLWLSPASFAIPYILFLLAPVAFDYLAEKRVRFLTTAMAIGLFAYQVLQAVVIGPSSEWHRFAEWVSQ
jgi:hypothetical protein